MTTRREQLRERREKIAADVRDNPGRTYETIGTENGISRERVRQIAKRYGVNRRSVPKFRVCVKCLSTFGHALSACPACGEPASTAPVHTFPTTTSPA